MLPFLIQNRICNPNGSGTAMRFLQAKTAIICILQLHCSAGSMTACIIMKIQLTNEKRNIRCPAQAERKPDMEKFKLDKEELKKATGGLFMSFT